MHNVYARLSWIGWISNFLKECNKGTKIFAHIILAFLVLWYITVLQCWFPCYCFLCSRARCRASPQWSVLQPGPVLFGWIKSFRWGAYLQRVCPPQCAKSKIQNPGWPITAWRRPRTTGTQKSFSAGISHHATLSSRKIENNAALTRRLTKRSLTR